MNNFIGTLQFFHNVPKLSNSLYQPAEALKHYSHPAFQIFCISLYYVLYFIQNVAFIRYFPGRGNICTNELFIFIFTPKMENPVTTRVYCSVQIFTVNLQAITTYPPYLTTICRNDKITFTFLLASQSEIKCDKVK